MADYENKDRSGSGGASRGTAVDAKPGKPGGRTKVAEVYGAGSRSPSASSAPEPLLPSNCPPAIPKHMSIVALDTGGLGGRTRDLWREHLQGELFHGWDEINRAVSADFWREQLLVEPKVAIQPGADAGERYTRARSWLGIAAEFANCVPISNGESPTYEGSFLWTISINNQAVDVIRAGIVQFELPNQSLESEDTFALPLEEAGGPGSDAMLKAPRTKGRVMTDVGVEAGIRMLPWEFQATARDHLTEEVRQALHDAISSIWMSNDYGPKVLAEVWDDIKENWPQFVIFATGLIAVQITATALLAAPEGTVTKIIGVILEAIIFAFLIYAVVTEGAAVLQHGMIWWNLIREANGDPKKIAEAAEAFARIVLHLILALMAAAGLRSKVATAVPKPRPVTAEGKPFFKSQLRDLTPEELAQVKGAGPKVEPAAEPRAYVPDFEIEPPRTDLSQPGGLRASEGAVVRNAAGRAHPPAHVLAEHGPDVPLSRLRERVTSGAEAATKFVDRAKMETAIQKTIEARQAEIDAWLRSNPGPGANKRFDGAPGLGILGVGFRRSMGGGITALENLVNVRIILKADGGGGYVIHTAYPQ